MSVVKQILNSKNIAHKYHTFIHKWWSKQYALEASCELWINLNRIFKTLIVQWEKEMYCCIIWWEDKLDVKKLARVIGVKKIFFPNELTVNKSTGYVFWWVSPIWQKKRLKTFIDTESANYETIFVSAWIKWEEIEIQPNDLIKITEWSLVDIKQNKI